MRFVHIRSKLYSMTFWMFRNYSSNKAFVLFNRFAQVISKSFCLNLILSSDFSVLNSLIYFILYSLLYSRFS
nr:MAG TPA: hypothetical protein [Caudoviricetes sp.]